MSENDLIFSETMRLVSAEIGDHNYDSAQVEKLFDKYNQVVKSLYQKHVKKSPPRPLKDIL